MEINIQSYSDPLANLADDFAERWNVDVQFGLGSVTVLYAGDQVLHANLEKKRLVYNTGGPFLKEEFVEEFKHMARRMKYAVN